MRGSRNFRQGRGGGGGVQVSLTKNALTTFYFSYFFSPQLILQKSNGQFQRNLAFFKVPEGVVLFPEGSNCLFPIETHITCDFPGGGGGPDQLSPPLDPHLLSQSLLLKICPIYIIYLRCQFRGHFGTGMFIFKLFACWVIAHAFFSPVLSGLFWVQTVCQDYKQKTKVASCRQEVTAVTF